MRSFVFNNFIILLSLMLPYHYTIAQIKTTTCIEGNCINGKGKMIYSDGREYQGNWKNGKYDGLGKEIFKVEKNDKVYFHIKNGSWLNNQLNGVGFEIFDCTDTDGTNGWGSYGEFKNGLFKGRGTYIFPSGYIIDGILLGDKLIKDYINGLVHCNGICSIIDKIDGDYTAKTIGNFVNGKPIGTIVKVYKNGDIYYGTLNNDYTYNDLKEGIYLFSNGDKYEGSFKENKFDGNGIYIYKDNKRYIGQFKDGMKNGNGILYDKYYHIIHQGKFVNDNPTD